MITQWEEHMRTIAILLGVLVTGSTISAMAMEKNPTHGKPPIGKRLTAQPLTVNECKGLGGHVDDVSTKYCAKGLSCTIKATGRKLCITETE
jgi:hypothetical protein